MTKEESEATIDALFEPDGLLSRIREGELNPDKLDKLGEAVGVLNTLDLETADRARFAVILWEFAFHVSSCITWHYNTTDMFSFTNVSDRQLKALKNMVYWLSNRFSYNKPLEMTDLYFAGYMRWDGFNPNVPFDPSKTS